MDGSQDVSPAKPPSLLPLWAPGQFRERDSPFWEGSRRGAEGQVREQQCQEARIDFLLLKAVWSGLIHNMLSLLQLTTPIPITICRGSAQCWGRAPATPRGFLGM